MSSKIFRGTWYALAHPQFQSEKDLNNATSEAADWKYLNFPMTKKRIHIASLLLVTMCGLIANAQEIQSDSRAMNPVGSVDLTVHADVTEYPGLSQGAKPLKGASSFGGTKWGPIRQTSARPASLPSSPNLLNHTAQIQDEGSLPSRASDNSLRSAKTSSLANSNTLPHSGVQNVGTGGTPEQGGAETNSKGLSKHGGPFKNSQPSKSKKKTTKTNRGNAPTSAVSHHSSSPQRGGKERKTSSSIYSH